MEPTVAHGCYDEIMRRWLARLSFSFLILAAALAYHTWSHRRDGVPLPGPQEKVYYLISVLLVIFAALGTRERHRG